KNGLWVSKLGSDKFTRIILPTTTHSYGEASVNITNIRNVGNGQLWVGTLGSGLYILTAEGKVLNHLEDDPADPYSLHGNSVYTTYQDRNQNVWLGMYSGEGLNKVNPSQQQFEHYR